MHDIYYGIKKILEVRKINNANWVKYIDIDGKVCCRFVKVKAKYLWNCDLSQIWSLERMRVYSVSQHRCNCPSFKYETGLVFNTCKHQRMQSVLEKQQLTDVISANTGRKWMAF